MRQRRWRYRVTTAFASPYLNGASRAIGLVWPGWGQLNDDVFRCRVRAPKRRIASHWKRMAPLDPINHHVSDAMPQRGIAYQPRVPTLGIYPATFFAF